MRCAAKLALVALCSIACAEPGFGQIRIPKDGEGYAITKTDVSRAAPAGYEGRTDISTDTAVGNTPATAGKRFITHFTLGNQVKTCPMADGRAEGEGLFSISLDYTDAQASSGSNSIHIDMRATARYKGKVGDNAVLDGPVNADIDYTYGQTGSTRGPNGALATSPPINVAQHVTIPFTVIPEMNAPNIGAFAGGDPTAGHYGQALSVGTALVYWAGIYYSIAETRWLQAGTCAQVAFDPPSNSRQPVLGGDTKVNAQIKTKGGEVARGNFDRASARSGGGSVAPGGGVSDVGAPLVLTYTAPNQRVNNAGFVAHATSRAGVAEGEWNTGLGTDWSGQITSSVVSEGDAGNTELQDWNEHQAMHMTIDVKNGVGIASSYGEVSHSTVMRQKALRGGSVGLIFVQSISNSGSAEGSSKATVGVVLNQAKGTYALGIQLDSTIAGTQQSVNCDAQKCTSFDQPLPVILPLPTGGKLTDLNHVSGSEVTVTPKQGRSGTGKTTVTMTWDLARKGTTQ